ncbi:MAG: PAS domain-containing sensor histidine kinase, partial [Pedobacter sp.]
IWMTDNNGSQLYASPRWQEYTGIEPENTSWTEIVHPDDLSSINKTWTDSLAGGGHYSAEVRLKGKDSKYRWFYAQGVPVKRESGAIVKWIGSFTDIHDQKEIAEKLEILVNERTAALQRSNNDLQQFAHVASHDLKEPLRKIRTFTRRLVDDTGSSFSDKGLQFLGRVNSAADRMVEMIEGVLNYSMLNAGHQSLQVVDLNEVIANVTQDLELLIIEKRARINYERLPSVHGAGVLIYQLFYNLVNNSLKFSDSSVADPVISISSQVDQMNNRVVINVKDNGIGFDPAYAETIFDAFSRLNSRDRFEGTGLGLSLCKRIAERHGGNIRAVGETGKGALFIITLSLRLNQKFV